MPQIKSLVHEKINNKPYLLINLLFGFFPISFVVGSAIVNLNFFLFCCLGIFYLKSKIFEIRFNFVTKIIFLFFFIIFFSTGLILIKSLYLGEYDSGNLQRLIKSILFFRFFLFLIITYLLNKFDILNFKYFFLIAAFSTIIVSIDIIFQSFFGFNTVGQTSFGHLLDHQKHMISPVVNSGFFGDEHVAGGYIQRFAFFSVLFTILVFNNKNYIKFISAVIVVCILAAGILFSANRMPLILFIFGLLLFFLFNFKIKKILLVSLFTMLILLNFILSSNELHKERYGAFLNHSKNIITLITAPIANHLKEKKLKRNKSEQSKTHFSDFVINVLPKNVPMNLHYTGVHFDLIWESYTRRLFLTAFDTWKFNKIFGNGIKSFSPSCQILGDQPDVNLQEITIPGKKNRLCSNHPHNYYLEILTSTGIVGLIMMLIIAFSFMVFIFKNFGSIKKINRENFILLAATISLILEGLPLRTSGSIFTTNNATYLVIIASIVLSYKKILEIKTE